MNNLLLIYKKLVMNTDEPTYYSETKIIGDLEIDFKGEKFSGRPILDTSVKINGETLCWITWNAKEAFTDEINSIISKYRI